MATFGGGGLLRGQWAGQQVMVLFEVKLWERMIEALKGLKYTAKGEWGWVGALFFLNRRKKRGVTLTI